MGQQIPRKVGLAEQRHLAAPGWLRKRATNIASLLGLQAKRPLRLLFDDGTKRDVYLEAELWGRFSNRYARIQNCPENEMIIAAAGTKRVRQCGKASGTSVHDDWTGIPA
jgi:hypothetical protein